MTSLEYTGAFDAEKYECTSTNPFLAELIREKINMFLKIKNISAPTLKTRLVSGGKEYEIMFNKE